MNDSSIVTLEAYKKLTEVQNNHKELLKEKTIILYVATLLESKNVEILNLCLDILKNFISNEETHDALMKTFGVFEALESLSLRLRHSDYSLLAQRTTEIIDVLRNSAPPAYSTRNRLKKSRRTTFVYLLYIEELTQGNHIQLEEALIKIKDIMSFVVDLEHKRCTVRIGPNLSIRNLAIKIDAACGMKPSLVTCDSDKKEILLNILDEDSNKSYPEYFPEKETPPKDNAVKTFTGSTNNANSLFKAFKDFWTGSFYW